jgi:hypothetical protein
MRVCWRACKKAARASFQAVCLLVMLAASAGIPILQLATLGYLLEVSRRWALGRSAGSRFPGLSAAGKIGQATLAGLLSGLPVWWIVDQARTAALIAPQSELPARWQTAAQLAVLLWLLHLAWALLRGGRWWHFLWPQPIRFVQQAWRPRTWIAAEERAWWWLSRLRLGSLLWLGLKGAVVGLTWLAAPAALLAWGVLGDADQQPVRGLATLVGIVLMGYILLHLPFLQVQQAVTGKLRSGWAVSEARRAFQRAPWAFALGLWATLLLAIPLYLLRIETVPAGLLWILNLLFVLLALPGRMLAGWAVGRSLRGTRPQPWFSRWPAWTLELVPVPVYLLILYLAPLAAWDGLKTFWIQHAFLVPTPF